MTYQIWACEPSYLEHYLDALNVDVVEAARLDLASLGAPEDIMTIANGEARIKVRGVLSQRGLPPIAKLFGFEGTSYGDITKALAKASDREDIECIVLELDTPGGEVAGVDGVYSAIRAAAADKRVIAENHGMVASAGYWLASAADQIVAMSPVVETGSIGVVLVHSDTTEADAQRGVKKTKIVSRNAPLKNATPETEAGMAALQERADAIERVFMARIAQGRGTDAETIATNFGRGALLVAEDPDEFRDDALSIGMIDTVIDGLKKSAVRVTNDPITTPQSNEAPTSAEAAATEEKTMANLKELMAADRELAVEVEQLCKAAVESKVKAVLPYLQSDYPASIKKIACDVLAGVEEQGVLRGAIIAYDALREKDKTDAAIAETKAIGETRGAMPKDEQSKDGIIRGEQDFQKAKAELARYLGREGN